MMFRSGTKVGWGYPLHDNGPDPDEYFERASAHAGGSPEKRLRLAVLLNAIAHLKRGSQHSAADEAARWVRGEVDAMDASFSFHAICETLDLDPGWLAQALLRPADDAMGDPRLPRRQVRTQRLHGEARRYRPRVGREAS
jgi:hypothetical protein